MPTSLDPDRVRQAWPFTFVFESEVDSTNSLALEQCRRGVTLPILVLAQRQRAGRGRNDTSWWSGDGSLTFSVALAESELRFDRDLVPLAAGCAVALSIEAETDNRRRAQIKWPNDVLLDGRKASGILVETVPHPSRAAVIGIGVNVDRAGNQIPSQIAERSAWVADWVGHSVDCTDFLLRILKTIQSLCNLSEEQWLDSCYNPRCYLSGRLVRAVSGSDRVVGECLGIDRQGQLRLRLADDTTVAIRSAHIELLENDTRGIP